MKNDDYPPHGRHKPKRVKVREPRGVDLHEASVIEGADFHTATSFLGGGRYEIVKRKSRRAAEEAARRMIEKRDPKDIFNVGRPVLIYAVKGVHQVVAGTVYPERRGEKK